MKKKKKNYGRSTPGYEAREKTRNYKQQKRKRKEKEDFYKMFIG